MCGGGAGVGDGAGVGAGGSARGDVEFSEDDRRVLFGAYTA